MARHRCPKCNTELSTDVPEGLCPECLLRQAIEAAGNGGDPEEERRPPSPMFVPPAPAQLAEHFPQLEILQLVGQGGMGAVYKARQPKLDRLVAVKVLPVEVARDSSFAERFTREARSLARLNHPNIVTIYDFGQTDGLFYFTMEFVDGKNVRDLLQAGELIPAAALKIVPQVCDALQYAHDEGVVHRDIKPENILVDRKGRVKIADFGLAKIVGLSPAYLTMTGTHEVMGTLYYMAPEQMKRSHQVDHRADIYSLGVVFYEMLTGELPVGSFKPPSHKAGVDGRLDPIVLRALSREPEHRYQDAAALKKDVELVLAGGRPAVPADLFPPELFRSFVAPQGCAPGRPVAVAVPLRDPRLLGRAAGVGGNWPSVRFSIPQISWYGAKATGEIYRDEEALIVEFREHRCFRTESKEVRIPISEIVSISCQTDYPKGMPGVAAWMFPTQIVIKAARPGALDALPIGKHGRGRLLVHWGDREAAKQLVESLVRRTPPNLGRGGPGVEGLPGSASDPARVRLQVIAPAVGLFLTAIVAIVCEINIVWHKEIRDFAAVRHLVLPQLALALTASAFVLIGAVRMMMRDSYFWACTAAILAMVPWSPGWIIGLPVGIWAIAILRKPEVKAAFLGNHRGAGVGVPGVPEPPPLVHGKVRSFFRNVGRYFISGLSGRHSFDQSRIGNERADEPPDHPADSHPPLAQTVDYPAEPGEPK